MQTAETLAQKEPGTGVHPLRMLLWLMMLSISMIFAAYTSAYIVRRDEGNWLEYDLPAVMLINTLIILASSATVQWAWFAARRDEVRRVQLALTLTVALGVAFW